MKTTSFALILIAAISAAAEASLRGIHENDATPTISDQRYLKKDKKSPKPPKDSGGGGNNNGSTGGDDDTNRAGVEDGTCCNGPARPQPATGPGNRAPSNCPELGKPATSLFHQEGIAGIHRWNSPRECLHMQRSVCTPRRHVHGVLPPKPLLCRY